MRLLPLILAAALFAAPAAVFAQSANSHRPPADKPMQFADSDPAMNAAIAEARRSLPDFWKRFDTDPVVAETAKVKMAFDTPDGGEVHLWIRELRREGGAIVGILDNQPANLPGLAKGDTVTIVQARLSDWRYVRDGRMYGGFTTRVMVPRLPADQQAMYRQILSENPLESGRP